jgi:hypothetical protein
MASFQHAACQASDGNRFRLQYSRNTHRMDTCRPNRCEMTEHNLRSARRWRRLCRPYLSENVVSNHSRRSFLPEAVEKFQIRSDAVKTGTAGLTGSGSGGLFFDRDFTGLCLQQRVDRLPDPLERPPKFIKGVYTGGLATFNRYDRPVDE